MGCIVAFWEGEAAIEGYLFLKGLAWYGGVLS